MNTNIGLWIDQRRAVIVLAAGEIPEIRIIHSHADRQPGRSEGARSMVPFEALQVEADDVTQRKFAHQLQQYYEEITGIISSAKRLLIFGPGEAKLHLHTYLEAHLTKAVAMDVQPADKMTDRQIAAHVREHFKKTAEIILSR